MPKLPQAIDRGGRPSLRSRRPIVSDQSAVIEAESLGEIGNTLATIGLAKLDLDDKFAYSSAKSQLLLGELDIRESFENDSDWETYEPRLREQMGKLRERLSAGLRNTNDRATFDMESELELERSAGQIRKIARKKEVDIGRATLIDQTDKLMERGFEAEDINTRRAAIQESNNLYAGARDNEFITAEQAEAGQQRWTQVYARKSIQLMELPEQIRILKKASNIQQFMVSGEHKGLIEKGNINILTRPQVQNEDAGGVSSVFSMSFEEDGVEIVVPRVSDEGRIMSEEAAIKEFRKTGEHLGKFETAKTATAYSVALHKQQEKHYGGGGGSIADFLNDSERADLLRQAETRLSAQNKALAVGLTRQANDVIKMHEAGFSTDTELIERALVANEKFDKLAELQSAKELQRKLAIIQAAPLAVQTEILNDMREELSAGKLNPEDFQFYQAAEQVRARTDTMLDNDPRRLAIEQGVIEPDEPLNVESIESFALSLAGRRASAELATAHYGAAVPVIDAAEADQMGRFWEQASIDDKLSISQAIVTGLGPAAGDVLDMLDKKGFRIAAYTGGLQIEGMPGVAAAVLRGEEILRDPQARKGLLPEGTERGLMDEYTAEIFGSAFAFLPSFRGTTLRAIDAYYADDASSHGEAFGEWNRQRHDDAIAAIVGNIVEDRTGGQVPIREVEQTQFSQWLDFINADMITAAGGVSGFEPEEAANLVRRSRIIAVGPGRFNFIEPNPFSGQPQVYMNDDGKRFELVMNIADLPPVLPPETKILGGALGLR